MKKVAAIVLATVLTANAGVVKFSAKHIVKPAAKATVKVVTVGGKTVSFPVRHPKKSAHGLKKAGVATKKFIY